MQPATIPYIIGLYDYYGMTYDEAYKKYYAENKSSVHGFYDYNEPPSSEGLNKTPDEWIKNVWEMELAGDEYEFAKETISFFLNKDNDKLDRVCAHYLAATFAVAREKQDLANS
jgi:hypothetical protein